MNPEQPVDAERCLCLCHRTAIWTTLCHCESGGTWDRRPIGHPDRERQCPFCNVIYVDEAMARDCRCYRQANLNTVDGDSQIAVIPVDASLSVGSLEDPK